jgi:hypothetical protein
LHQSQNAIVLKIGDHAVFNVATDKALWPYNTPSVVTPPVVNGKDINVITSTGEAVALD